MGYTIPLLFALIFIPPLISGLGKERFGLLSLSWVIIGYFSFFDFGIGKSVTKVIAERIGIKDKDNIPLIFWNSLSFLFWISIFVMSIGLLILPQLLTKFIKISPDNYHEALTTFYLIIFSIPLVTTTTSVRGFLEAYQKFNIVNLYRTILGISTFVLPYVVLLIVDNLFWIVFSLLLIRLIVWIFYLSAALKTNNDLLKQFSIFFKFNILKPVLKISIWIMIVNIVGPIILYSDRFLISSLISLTAVTFYSTPYEMITKLLILPTAFVGVLFPAFSASYAADPDLASSLFKRSAKFVFIILFPIIFLITVFSFEGLSIWLDTEFANKSVLVLQYLAIGILFSSISSIPNNFFQGIGKPHIPAILNLIELPIYILFMYLFIQWFGIVGAAFFWMIAAGIDAVINYLIAYLKFGIKLENSLIIVMFLFLLLTYLLPFNLDAPLIKILVSMITIVGFFFISWNMILLDDEKKYFIEKISNLWNRR